MAQRHSAYCLGGLAATAASRGNAKRAGRLWGAVEAFEASRRLTLQSPERQRYELRIARVEGSTFEAAATVGQRPFIVGTRRIAGLRGVWQMIAIATADQDWICILGELRIAAALDQLRRPWDDGLRPAVGDRGQGRLRR